MSKVAPDTRNKLDDNKPLKKKNTNTRRVTLGDLPKKTLKTSGNDLPLKLNIKKKPTKGELFKKEKGYSLTQHKNMLKYDVDLEGLKLRTKKRKEAEERIKKEKHKESVAFKKANGKKGAKGSKQASKTVASK